MSLSSNTAQTRELGELRNHLKWLDEERRKSARKMAELEQRFAQQGRELAERDQKIQELEWHVANFTERFERLPQQDPNVAGQEQRLQDLEWHLTNINSQLARLPNMDEERVRQKEELAVAAYAVQQQVQSDQTQLEGRLLAEVATVREANSRLTLQIQSLQETLPSRLGLDDRLAPLSQQQADQAQALDRLDSQYVALQQSIDMLAAQLRERTVGLAAESQTNLTALAARVQEHLEAMDVEYRTQLDALSEQYEMRTNLMAAEWQEGLNTVANRGPEISPEFIRFGERLNQIDENTMVRIAAVEQASSERLAHLERRTAELDALLAPLGSSQADLAATVEHLPGLAAQVSELEQQVAEIGAYVSPLGARQVELEAAVELLPRFSVQLAELDQRLDEVQEAFAPLSDKQVALATVVAELPNLKAAVEEIAPLKAAVEEIAPLKAAVEEIGPLKAAVEEIGPLKAAVKEIGPLKVAVEQVGPLKAAVEEIGPLKAAVEQIAPLSGQVTRLEEAVGKLGNVREIMPLLAQMEQEMELRQAEELRLANLIGAQEGRFAPLTTSLDDLRETNLNAISRLSEVERLVEEVRRSSQDFNDNWKPLLTEVNRRVGPLTERLTVLNNTILKAEASLEALSGDQSEVRERVVNLSDDVQRSRIESSRQLEAWQATIDEHKETIERFTQQWLTLSNQYKEARMAVQNFAHWQKQLEQQKREASEMVRIETNRMQSRWDGFLMEIQEKLKNFELDLSQKWQAFEFDNEQKWATARRGEQVWREQLGAVDELIQKMQQDNRSLIWRVQAAQADAIKKWPRLLMEEVEKAVELNPNRRLTSTATPPRADMSVVDAIEQGLIKIDYSDDSALDL